MRRFLPIGCLLLGTIGALHAQTLVEVTAGIGSTSLFLGQAFTIPGAGPWSVTSFNYFSDTPGVTPAAQGKLYLFSAPYTGTPAGLTVGLPNLLAVSSVASGGKFTFSPGVTLQGNTPYYVFGDTSYFVTGGAGSAGSYFSAGATSPFFFSAGGTANYRVTGGVASTVPIGTPALISLSLLLAGVASFLMRRQQSLAA
jgi:hypothetical protein